MKIFSTEQINKANEATIKQEPVSSLLLMERAAEKCTKWLLKKFDERTVFYLFCGNGNNGGDGLAIARLLRDKGRAVNVYMDVENKSLSDETAENLKKLKLIPEIHIQDFSESRDVFEDHAVLIDAIFGTGLNRSVGARLQKLFEQINQFTVHKVAIDLPSGLFADELPKESFTAIAADDTLSFQFWKKAFLQPETGIFCGKIHILDIGLNEKFIDEEKASDFVISNEVINAIYKPRSEFSHKGTYGKTTIVAGSFGMMGAAVLATKAACRAGSGLTVVVAPNCGYNILQTNCPEAMFIEGGGNFISQIPPANNSSFGIGPGLGTEADTADALMNFLKNHKSPLVLDADALNILSKHREYLMHIPEYSIITPHPKEFERLFGKTTDSFARLRVAKEKAQQLKIYIVLRDHHTQIITPKGRFITILRVIQVWQKVAAATFYLESFLRYQLRTILQSTPRSSECGFMARRVIWRPKSIQKKRCYLRI